MGGVKPSTELKAILSSLYHRILPNKLNTIRKSLNVIRNIYFQIKYPSNSADFQSEKANLARKCENFSYSISTSHLKHSV